MSRTPLIEIINVSYEAGGNIILDHVSWRIESGQHWAVLGPNGAGKTTLLRIACGYIWPNAGGSVRRLGQPLQDLRRLRRSIGWISSTMVSQVPPSEPVLDTVVSGRYAQIGLTPLAGEPPTDMDFDTARECLAPLGCLDLIEKRFGVLSQGEQQKVLIARARMAQPLLIILDEPCAGMDPGAREKFLKTVGELVRDDNGPSLVLVTHHMEEIMPGIEHLLVMNHGRIVGRGAMLSVLNEKTIGEVYDVPISRLVNENGRIWPIWK